MALTATPTDVHPGAIVHVPQFPFEENNQSKPRPALVIDVNHKTRQARLRGIYSNRHRRSAPISATYETNLDHDSFVADRIVTLPLHRIATYIGEAPYDYDPFNDGF